MNENMNNNNVNSTVSESSQNSNMNQGPTPNPGLNTNMNQGPTSNPGYNPNMIDDEVSNNKIAKNLKNDFLVLAILSLIASIGVFFLSKDNSNIMIRAGIQIGYTLLLFWGYAMAKQEKKSAGILGIVVGILMILTFFSSIIDAILGLFLLIHSVRYNKYY